MSSVEAARQTLTDLTTSGRVVILGEDDCPFTQRTKAMLEPLVAPDQYKVHHSSKIPHALIIQQILVDDYNYGSIPAVFIDGKFVGGFSEVNTLHSSGELQKMLSA